KSTERVQFFARSEMNSRNLVDHVTQQITVDHAIDRSFEDGRDYIASVAAVAPAQAAQVRKEPRAARLIRQNRLFIIYERNQFIAGDPFRLRRPITPPIRRIDRALKFLSR